MTVADLKKGESATIRSLVEDELTTRIMELGCLPGERITVKRIAPLGDPIVVEVSGYELGLRRSEAKVIQISK